jgi:hypothetical protein
MATRYKRLTLDMGEKFDHLLTEEADSSSTTKADIVRKAVMTYAFLRREVEAGGKISVTDPDGNVRELVLT